MIRRGNVSIVDVQKVVMEAIVPRHTSTNLFPPLPFSSKNKTTYPSPPGPENSATLAGDESNVKAAGGSIGRSLCPW